MLGKLRITKITGLLLGLLLVGYAQAGVFQCRDANGGVRFQDHPCQGKLVTAADSVTAKDISHSGNHYLWQADAGKGTLYLLGSIHFGTPQMYPLPGVMTTSFKRSDALVVEAKILDVSPADVAHMVAAKAIYQDGDRLHNHLSSQSWKRLEQVAKSLGMSVEMIYMQKPWFVSMTMTTMALKKLGYSEDEGIDIHFLRMAKGKKRVIELESLSQQLSLFEQLSVEEQVMMLEETLDEVEHGKKYFDEMLGYWRAGDPDGIQKIFEEGVMKSKAGERVNRVIITDRNRRMVARLDELARQGGRYFVVVGAGHLSGPEGILAQLKQRGYQVVQR